MEWKKFTIICLLVILVVAFSGLAVLAGKAPTQKGKFFPQKTVVKPNVNFKSAVKNTESSGEIKFTIKEITKETANISMTPSDNKTRIVPPPENAEKVIMNVEAKSINDLPASIKKDANTTLTLKVKEPVKNTDNPQFTIKPIKSSDDVEWTVEKLPYQTETFDVRYYNSKKDPSIQGIGTMESVVRGTIRDENGNALRDVNVAVFDCANFGPGATPLAVTKTVVGGFYRVQFLAGLRVIAFERCQGEWIFVNYKQRVGDICIATPMGDSMEVSGRLPACGAGYPVSGQFFHKDRIDPATGKPMPWPGVKIGVYDRWGNPIVIGNTVPIEAVTNDTGAYMLRIPAMEIPKGIQFGVQRGCTNGEIFWVSLPPDNTPGEIGLLPPKGFIVGGKLPECGADKFIIKGRLTDQSDAPLVGARIFATTCMNEPLPQTEAFTDSLGEYILGIPLIFARNVSLHFTPPYPDNTCKYTLSNWDGGTCINLIEEAGLSIGEETNRIEISGRLPSCGNPPIITFSGTFYDSTWAGWEGIRIEAQDCEGNVLSTAFTDQSGYYSLEFPAGLRRIAVYRDDACGVSLSPIFVNDPRGNICINFNKIDRWNGVVSSYWVDGVLPGCYDENTLVVTGNIAYIDSIGMPIGDEVNVQIDVWECVAGGLNHLGSDTTEPWGEFWLKVPRPASMRVSFTKLCDGSVFWLQPKGMGECIPTGANSWWGIPPQSIWINGELPKCGKGSTIFTFAGTINRSTGFPFNNIQVQIWNCPNTPALPPSVLASWTTDQYGYFHGSVDLNDGFGKVQPIQIVFIRNCNDPLFNKPYFLKNREGGTCFTLPRSNETGFPKYHYNLNGSLPDCGVEGLTIRGQLWRHDAYWDSLTGMYVQDKTAFHIWQCAMPPNEPPLKTVFTDSFGNFEFNIAPGEWKFAIDRMCKPDSTGFVDGKIFWVKDATGNTCFGLFPHQTDSQIGDGEIPFPNPTGEFWFWAELPACRKNTAIVKGQLTVPDPSGSGNIIPLDNTWVFAYPCKNFNEPWNDMLIPTATMTDNNGYYTLEDVPAGRPIMIGVDVKGRFGCWSSSWQWVDWFYWLTPEWNPNQLCWILPPAMKEITKTVPNCDAFIRYIISGSIYSDYGFPMDGFGVKLVDLNNPSNIFRMITDAGGTYWFEVPAGTYGVRPEMMVGWNFEPKSATNPMFAYTVTVPMCPPQDPACDPNFWDGYILIHPPANMKQAYLWIDDGYGTAGSTFDLPVKLDSRDANVTAKALEFSVYYNPDMLTGKSATAIGLAAGAGISTAIDNMVPVTLPGGMTVYAGRMKVLIMGAIAPDSGEVALLKFDVSPNAQLCDGSVIWLKEAKLIDTSNNGIWVNTRNGFFLVTSTTTNFQKGDVNFDGVVDNSDLDYLICYVFGDTTHQGSYALSECIPEPDKWCVFWVVADMNNDGTIDAVDVQKLKNMIIPPPPPDPVGCTKPDSLIIHNKDLGGFVGTITNIDVFLANCRVLGSIEAKVTYNASQLQLVAMALAPNPAFDGLEFIIPANFAGDGSGDDTVRILLTDLQGIKKIPSMSENGNRPWKLFQLFFLVKSGKVDIQGISQVGFAFLSSTDGSGNPTPISGSSQNATSVTFAKMQADVLPNGVNLTWLTTSENNNIGFNIYRTADLNKARVKINSNIIPAGNGNYSYFDYNVSAGTYYYWIEDVESDGSARRTGPIVVNIDAKTLRPTEYRLSQNYPNPFNPSTEISFSIPKSGKVELSIYNVNGQLIRTLVDNYRDVGNYTVKWDGKDNKGKEVSSGLYLYTLKSGEFSATKKMLLMK